jgi:hypothetical protein
MLGYNDGVRGSEACSVAQVRVQRGSDIGCSVDQIRVQRGSDILGAAWVRL